MNFGAFLVQLQAIFTGPREKINEKITALKLTLQSRVDIDVESVNRWIDEILKDVLAPTPQGNSISKDEQAYRSLLPYALIAYQFEKNGIPEEHARKLARLFEDKDGAIKYLLEFSKKNPEKQLMHDSCLFTLPTLSQGKNFRKLRDMAKKENFTYMFNRVFLMQILPLFGEIEKLVLKNNQHKQIIKPALIEAIRNQESEFCLEEILAIEKNKTDNSSSLKLTKKTFLIELSEQASEQEILSKGIELLNAKIAAHKKVCDAFETNQPLGIRDKIGEQGYKKSQLAIEKLRARRSEFFADQPFCQLSFDSMFDYLMLYRQGAPGLEAYFRTHGISEAYYTEFLTLDRRSAGIHIPQVEIDGAMVGYPGYYLRRLTVQDINDAALAACLGKLTDCCQSFSGEAGTPCVRHGLTSPEGGFYVVCKGDIKNPKPLEDKVVCQSWVWRSQSEAIVIDSIEVARIKEAQDIAKAFYYELAFRLTVNTNSRTFKICCGEDSGLFKEIKRQPHFPRVEELPQDYKGYRDSTQFTLCSLDLLYLLPSGAKEFFKRCQTQQLPPTDSVFITVLNSVLIHVDYRELRDRVLHEYKTMFPIVAKEIIEICKNYLKDLDQLTADRWSYQLPIKKTVSMACKTPYLLHMKSQSGDKILQLAARDAESLKLILNLYPVEDRLAAVQEKDREGRNVLQLAVNNPESLKLILSLYRVEDRLAAVQAKDREGRNVLQLVVNNPESLKLILSLYRVEDRLAAVQEKDREGRNVLQLVVNNPESLKLILSLYRVEDRLAVLKKEDKTERSVLQLAASNPLLLKEILSLLPEEDRLAALKQKYTHWGKAISGLKLAASNPLLLKEILSLLPKKDQLEVLKYKNREGSSVLQLVVSNLNFSDLHPQSPDGDILLFKEILSFYPEKERLAALQEKDKEGRSVLHLAASNALFFKEILSLLPEENRLEALKEQDRAGRTGLQLVTSDAESLKLILSLLPEKDGLEVLREKNKEGVGLLYSVAREPELLKLALKLYPEQDRLSILKRENGGGLSVLHHSAKNPESFKVLLQLYPEQDRLAVVQHKNRAGMSVFGMFLLFVKQKEISSESCEQIVSLFPEQDRLAVLKQQNLQGASLLKLASEAPELLQQTLRLLPKEILSAAPKEKSSEDILKFLEEFQEGQPSLQWMSRLRSSEVDGDNSNREEAESVSGRLRPLQDLRGRKSMG